MSKTVVVSWDEFMKPRKIAGVNRKGMSGPIAAVITAAVLCAAPVIVHADGWNDIWTFGEDVGDYLCRGALMFCGGMWIFGHRSKALEMVISICIGYEIVIHAGDVQAWLKGLGHHPAPSPAPVHVPAGGGHK